MFKTKNKIEKTAIEFETKTRVSFKNKTRDTVHDDNVMIIIWTEMYIRIDAPNTGKPTLLNGMAADRTSSLKTEISCRQWPRARAQRDRDE